MKKITRRLKHVIPWFIAALIFVYLFHLYPPERVIKSLTYVNLWFFSSFAIGYFLFIYLVDSWVMTRVLRNFSYKVDFKDIAMARGATYLIMILNYPASQAAFAYYLKRRYAIPILEALSVFIFIVFIDLLWVVTLAIAGSFFQDYTIGGVDLGRTVKLCGLGIYFFTLLWLAFWRRWPERMLGRQLRLKFIERFRNRAVFHIFEKASAGDYLRTAVMRTPIHFTIIISMYVIFKTFGASIPFTKILGNVPLVFFVGTLPITPGGLGTTNAVMVELLYKYLTGPIFNSGQISPKELIFTATLLWMFTNYLFKVLIGSFFLSRVSKHLFEPTEDVVQDVVEKEAPHISANI